MDGGGTDERREQRGGDDKKKGNETSDAPYQVQPLHIIGGKVDHMTNRDLTNGHLTQSQDLDEDREVA